MTRIEASGLVPEGREAVFAFLSALENHWALAGPWIEVESLDRPAAATGGRVRLRGPLGLRRTAVTRVELVDAPARMEGTAELHRTLARVSWTLTPRGPQLTEVRLAASVVRAGALDRVVLALGGTAWMRRLFAQTLGRLAARFGGRIPARERLSSARA